MLYYKADNLLITYSTYYLLSLLLPTYELSEKKRYFVVSTVVGPFVLILWIYISASIYVHAYHTIRKYI